MLRIVSGWMQIQVSLSCLANVWGFCSILLVELQVLVHTWTVDHIYVHDLSMYVTCLPRKPLDTGALEHGETHHVLR